MRVFITGAAGHIGSAVVSELASAGHQVVGLARSDPSAAELVAAGAEVRRGDVNDLPGLRDAVGDVDAVIHLAFDNAAAARGDLPGAAEADLAVVRTFGDALAGIGKAYAGIGIGPTGDPEIDARAAANPRSAVSAEVASFSARGIRSMLIAIPPVTHSGRDVTGFIPTLIRIARASGVSGYVGDGAALWPAVHTQDLARLYRLAIESAPAGSQLFGAAEPGVPVREIAAAIGRHLGIPARSIDAGRASEHFGGFGMIMTLPFPPMPNGPTRALLGWEPTHPGLLADIDAGHYFTRS